MVQIHLGNLHEHEPVRVEMYGLIKAMPIDPFLARSHQLAAHDPTISGLLGLRQGSVTELLSLRAIAETAKRLGTGRQEVALVAKQLQCFAAPELRLGIFAQ